MKKWCVGHWWLLHNSCAASFNGLEYAYRKCTAILFLVFQFPQNGELILQRLILQFKRGFRRNDKNLCLSSTRFVAHLVNQQVVRGRKSVWVCVFILTVGIYVYSYIYQNS